MAKIEQTSTHRIRLDLPVFVDPRMSIKEVHKIAGIEEWISPRLFTDVKPIPEVPYVCWLHSLHLGLSAKEAKKQFESDEVGTILFEISSFYLYRPDFVENYAFGAGEASFELNGTKYHPRLSRLSRGGAKLDVVDANYQSPHYGILTRRQEIYFPASTKP